jgi:hypothetical protein
MATRLANDGDEHGQGKVKATA